MKQNTKTEAIITKTTPYTPNGTLIPNETSAKKRKSNVTQQSNGCPVQNGCQNGPTSHDKCNGTTSNGNTLGSKQTAESEDEGDQHIKVSVLRDN